MDKKDKAPAEKAPAEKAKPTAAAPTPAPAMKQGRWPGHGSAGGVKNAKSGHDRKTMGRGAARGR